MEKKAVKEVTESTTDIFKMQIEMMMKNEREKMDLVEFIINDLIESAVLKMREDCFDGHEDGRLMEEGDMEKASSPEYRIDSDDEDCLPNETGVNVNEDDVNVGNQDDKLDDSMDVDKAENLHPLKTTQDKNKDIESATDEKTSIMETA